MPGETTSPDKGEQASGKDAVFQSPEIAELMTNGLHELVEAAKEVQGAVRPYDRKIHRLEHEYDPNGVDPESKSPGGAIVEKHVPIPTGEGLQTTEWRTPVGDEGSAYHWTISFPKDNPDATPMVTLETPVDQSLGDFNLANAARAGVKPQGRRLQDFLIQPDGTVDVRGADYTKVWDYRLKPGSQTQGKATEGQIEFLRSNLGAAELVTPSGENTGVKVADVAPDFVQEAA